MGRVGQRAIGAVLLLGALFGVAMWWVQRGPDDDRAHGPARRSEADPSAPLDDAAGAAERTKVPLERSDGARHAENDGLAAAAVAATSDPPRDFHVHVFDEADGHDVAHASVLVSRFSSEVLAHSTTEWGLEPALQTHSGLEPISSSAISSSAVGSVRSDGAGDAVIVVATTKAIWVDVLAKGYAPVWFATGAERGTRERPLEVGLAKTASLRGTVFGSDRQPAAGTRLLLQFDRRHLERPRPAFGSMLGAARGQCETVTDASGKFEFVALPADVELTLEAGADEEQMRASQRCLWLDPGEQRELTWNLPRAASVSGRVVTSDGKPVAGATLLVVNFAKNVFEPSTTDDLGAFRIAPAPTGAVELEVGPGDDRLTSVAVPLNLADGEERTGVEVRVDSGAPLLVHAFGPDGAEVRPSKVELSPPLLRLHAPGVFFGSRPEGRGAEFVPGVPLGDVVVRVVAPLTSTWPAVETTFHHDGAHECEVRFGAGGRLSGRIADALDRDRTVVATATLLRREASRCFWTAQVMQSYAAPGTFDFPNLAEGIYDVLAQSDDGRVGVAAKVPLGAGETRADLVVPLERGATLELLAIDLASTPAFLEPGRSIRFEARSAGTFVGVAFAAPQGRVHLTVPPGRVTIEAIAAGEVIDTKEVVATVGEVVRVRF